MKTHHKLNKAKASGILRLLFFLLLIIGWQKVYPQDSTYQKIMRMIDSVSTDSLVKHIKVLENAGGHTSRVNFTPGNDSAANYILKTFQEMPHLSSVTTDTFFITSAVAPYNTKPMFNFEATIQGKYNPDKIFIIGAHYDCSGSRMGSQVWQSQWNTMKVPGADDNATGVAALFEIARILSDPANGFNNAYTVKFVAFGAEESGPAYSGAHHGSISYAKKCKLNNQQIQGMVSVDMIGFNENHDYQAIVSNTTSQYFAQKFYEANTLFNTGLILNSPPFVNATYSDHASFWDEGYKAILLIENAPPWNSNNYYIANPFYHTTSDSFHTLNMPLVTKVTKWVLGTMAAFSSPLTNTDDVTPAPSECVLYQNYPNPFNSSTIVGYQIPGKAVISLKVCDILGKEVAVLFEGEQEDGRHELLFDASGLATGIYYLKLTADSFTSVKKMIFLK